ncbi:leader peptidase (prepilin peptidase) / N-methyltransferase [Streptomyces sp. LaPpAH-199]|uniref:prepilin peptidase n=1 Tax=Streptomyces TaxID=1883 RepID=UPI00088822B1|nr:A24 family peptidase [Streptomyces sp. LaPpAH-199]MYW77282.1 prepilin peptidase [Streptomyces sp. SID8369]SDB93499.1 leader peptidase (prepilin peptidase) / N-methyltransferase [Streptomyces sp. LaPpAH-199]
MDAVLLVVAAVWGAVTGLLIPRAAYRFAVEPEEPWRTACPAGHPLAGPVRGWLGPPRCAPCAEPGAPATPAAETPVRSEEAAAGPSATAAAPEADLSPTAAATAPQATPSPIEAAPDVGREAAPDTAREAAPRPTAAPALHPTTSTPATIPTPATAPVYSPRLLDPVVTAVVCVALAAATGARPELIAWLALTPVAVLLAVVDRRVHRLPDPLTLPLAAAAVLLLGGAALLPGAAGSWTSGLLGGLALGGFYFLLFLINPNGMGFGDVKLALALGVALGWYGWAVLFVGGFAGFLFGAAYGLGLVLLRGAGRKTGIPFGPFMITGALAGLLLGALAA